MKQLFTLFFFILSSTLFAQKDSSENYAVLNFPDSLYKIDITNQKSFLFSDSLLRFPFYNAPSSVSPINKSYQKKIFHVHPDQSINELLDIFQIKYTETFLFYQIGSANSQNLNLNHLQRINSKFSALAEYSRNKSDGFYLNQQGKSEKLNVLFNYISISTRYNLKPYFQYYNFSQNENGGINNDSLFISGNFSSSRFLETNISTARNISNHYQGGISQKLNVKSNAIRFYNDIGYYQQKRAFDYDPSDLYYVSLYIDTTATNDNYKTEKYYNEISTHFSIKNSLNKAGVRNEYLKYSQNSFDTASFENKIFWISDYDWKNSRLNFDFEYVLTGFNSGNFGALMNYQISNQNVFSKIQFQSVIINQSPEIFFLRMNGNHFQWNNNLQNVFSFRNKLEAESKYGEIKLTHEMISKYIYLDETIQVVQSEVAVQRIELNYHYIFDRKKIYWRNDLIFQNVFSGDIFYRVPDFTYSSDFRFKTKLKAMDLQIGLSANYRTSYFANAYDPALANFYLQNEIKSGNYPILDFYILGTVRTVDLKFTVAHFNSGLTGYNYYSTPLYPIAPRAFYFGLSWYLKD